MIDDSYINLESKNFSFEPSAELEIDKRLSAQQALVSQLCKFFQKGTCMKGNDCPFRHSKGIKREVCKHWLRGLCKKGDLCEYLHEYAMAKMSSCRFFLTFGKCNNPDCYFQHLRPEDKKKDCIWYLRGFCKHGPHCKNRHPRNTNGLCPNYMEGFCPNGPNCSKGGHPKYELQLMDDRTRLLTEQQANTFGGQDNPRQVTCSRCGSLGHKANLCPIAPASEQVYGKGGRKPGLRDVSQVTCFKCGQRGHYANVCINRRVAPPDGGYKIPLKPPVGKYQ